jgi:general secretion pathway protein K
MGLQRAKGVALIIVLMIVALVSVLATEMGARLQLQIQRVTNIKDNNQAFWYAISAEEYARIALATLMAQSSDVINLNQSWSEDFVFPLENGGIEAKIEDMHSCFNLNALPEATDDELDDQSETEAMEAFHNLLMNAGLGIDSYTADTIRDSIADWLDSDDQMRNYGAEDSEYESREFPYLSANNLFASQSELRLINGIEPQWLDKLLPLVCVIPDDDELSINVNTITEDSAPLLAALTGLTLEEANTLLAARPQDGWDDVDDFLSESALDTTDLSTTQSAWFDITTQHFMLHTKARYNKATFAMTSVLESSDDKVITVLRREFGVIK